MAPRSCLWETPALSQRLQEGWYPGRQKEHSGLGWAVLGCAGLWVHTTAARRKSRPFPQLHPEESAGAVSGGGIPQGSQAESNIVYAGAPELYRELPVPPLRPRTAIISLCLTLLNALP